MRAGWLFLAPALAACGSDQPAAPGVAPPSIDPSAIAIVAGNAGVVSLDLARSIARDPWPIVGTPRAVALDHGGDLALVAVDDLDLFERFRATDGVAAGSIEIEQSPTDVVLGRDGVHAFVLSGDRVIAVDVVTMTIVAHLHACDAPRAMVVSRDGERGFVACEGAGVAWLDVDDLDDVPDVWPVGDDRFSPRGIAIAADDVTLLALDASARALDLLDVTTGKVVDSIALPNVPTALAVSDDGAEWAIASPSAVTLVDAKSRGISLTKSIDGCPSIAAMAATNDGWVLGCDHVVATIRGSDLATVATIPIPFAATTLATPQR